MSRSLTADQRGETRVPSGEGARTRSEFHPDDAFFDGLSEAFGSRTLEIRAAGIRARLEGLSARQHADLAARYGIFARKGSETGPGSFDLVIELKRSPRASFLELGNGAEGNEPEYYRLLTRQTGRELTAWSYEWAARCDLAAGKALLATSSDDRVIFDRAVENFLRVAFAHLALEKGGFLLHGAAVVKNGRAFLFFGPSGSGKTTATLLSKGELVLSDDLVMITPFEENGGPRRFRAASVPFRGLLAPSASTNEEYEIAGFFRLVQDKEVFLEDVSRPRAVGEIVQSLPFVTESPEAAERILEIVSDTTAATRVSRLHFRKDPEFWNLLDNV